MRRDSPSNLLFAVALIACLTPGSSGADESLDFWKMGGGHGATGGVFTESLLHYDELRSTQLTIFCSDLGMSLTEGPVGLGLFYGWDIMRRVELGVESPGTDSRVGEGDLTYFELRAGPAFRLRFGSWGLLLGAYLVGNLGKHPEPGGSTKTFSYSPVNAVFRVNTAWMELFATAAPMTLGFPSHASLILAPPWVRLESRLSYYPLQSGEDLAIGDLEVNGALLLRFGSHSSWGLFGGVGYHKTWMSPGENPVEVLESVSYHEDRFMWEAGFHFPQIGFGSSYERPDGEYGRGFMYINSVQFIMVRAPDGSWLYGGGINRFEDANYFKVFDARATFWMAANADHLEVFFGIQGHVIGFTGAGRM